MSKVIPFLNFRYSDAQPAFIQWLLDGSEDARNRWSLHTNLVDNGPGLLSWAAEPEQEWPTPIAWIQRIEECLPLIPFGSTAWIEWLSLPKDLPASVRGDAARTIATFFLNLVSTSHHRTRIVDDTLPQLFRAINDGWDQTLPPTIQTLWNGYLEPYIKLPWLQQSHIWQPLAKEILNASTPSGLWALRQSFASLAPAVWERNIHKEGSAHLRQLYQEDDMDALAWLPKTNETDRCFHYQDIIQTLFPQAHSILDTIFSHHDWENLELIQTFLKSPQNTQSQEGLDYSCAVA